MSRMLKTGYKILLSVFFVLVMIQFTDNSVKAATTVDSFYFMFNGSKYLEGAEAELKRENASLYITTKEAWDTSTTVAWDSSEKDVVTVEADTSLGPNFAKIVRKGPGYSTITAVVTSGTSSYTISFTVKVTLDINHAATGTILATTTKTRVLTMDTIGEKKPVYLKYVDYDDAGGVSVSGSAISVSAVTFESDNEGVASVNTNGEVTAVGAGSAMITISSNTMSASDKSMATQLMVVVLPSFTLTFDNPATHTYTSIPKKTNTGGIAQDVPSSFVLESNAQDATNLTWVILDSSGNKIKEGATDRMSYTVSEISGNVSFYGVKAGTYEVYAFANHAFNEKTDSIAYAYMKLIVPIDLSDASIVMMVGDTYNILDNSNLPYLGVFSTYENRTEDGGSGANIADLDFSTYTIEAKRKGTVFITLTYDTGLDLYDGNVTVADKTIKVTVIDGISLSTTYATIYTKGTIKLDALTTDNTSKIVWTTSDSKIATVEEGVVTGVKEGKVTITAKQTVDGIVKKAACTIMVQQTITSIELDPQEVNLGIGDYKTLHATFSPDNIVGVSLQWKSSNEEVVQVVENSALTATIQGVSGGYAVISAINQDNVVVGYCAVRVRQAVTRIVLNETAATVSLGTRNFQLRATVYPENALNKNVSWSSTDTAKATVDQSGMVTFKSAGTVSIIATSEDSPEITAVCNLNIQIPVESIDLDETQKTMYVGDTVKLTYTMQPSDSSIDDVIWSSTNPSVATVDANGKVTAKSVGSTVIILKSVDGGYSVYCTITVRQLAAAVKFSISNLTLNVGEYYYIKYTLTPKGSTDNDLVWESSDTRIATVDKEGKVVAKKAGTIVIMARTKAGGTAYCNVTVTQPVTGLILNFSEKTININSKFTLEASVTPSTSTNLNVTWRSSDEKIVKVAKNGEVSGILGGTAVITATTEDGKYSEICVVTVKETATAISLDYESANLGVGKTLKLTATITPETATSQEVMWSSSNEDIATVNQKGKITGKKNGYVTITATALDGSDEEASCEVRVVNPVKSISISDNYVTLFVGDTEELKVTVKPSDATFKTAIWTSSDTSVAIVDDEGVVTGLKAGKATITAEAMDSSGKKVICAVVVYERVASTGITLQDKKVTMVPGESRKVEIVLIPAASTDRVTWSSDNPSVAKVDKKTGKITAVSTGKAYLSVMTDSGKTATVEVVVIGLNVKSIRIEQYTDFGTRLEVEGTTDSVTWSIDNSRVAVVNNGYVSSRGTGKATITAIVNGRRLRCKIVVVKIGAL